MRETSLQEIATSLHAKKDEGSPVVLFLGTRTGRLCHNQTLYNRLSRFSLLASTFDRLSDRKKLEECYKVLRGFSEYELYEFFKDMLNEKGLREEDDCLLELLRQDFFTIVISTNIDSALDPFLENERYTIVRFPLEGFTKTDSPYAEISSHLFFKAFGDLDALSYTSVSNEVDLNEEPDLKTFLVSLLAKDVMVIGYDPMWDSAIEGAFPNEGGNIWYIDEEGPLPYSLMSQFVTARQGKCVLGRQGNYKIFMNALHRHLIGGTIQKHSLVNVPFEAKPSADSNNREGSSKNYQQNDTSNSQEKSSTIHSEEERKRTKVFISYSHNDYDRRFLERLLVHLSDSNLSISNQKEASSQREALEIWYDGLIKPGVLWRDEIEKALEVTKVAVLLVSADFFKSEFITRKELPCLLKASRDDGVVILAVVLSSCRFETTVLKDFQSVNPSSKPLARMSRDEKERIWSMVAQRVNEMLPPLPETS